MCGVVAERGVLLEGGGDSPQVHGHTEVHNHTYARKAHNFTLWDQKA